MSDGKIGLSEVVEKLRKEIYELTTTASGEDLQFDLESVELELHVGVTKEGTGTATAKFWVLELEAEGKYAKERTQTVKLTMKPRLKGAPKGAEVPISRPTGERPAGR